MSREMYAPPSPMKPLTPPPSRLRQLGRACTPVLLFRRQARDVEWEHVVQLLPRWQTLGAHPGIF